jgi:hypothetical protein
MGRYIIKLKRGDRAWYLEWSSIVDAPVTYGMSLEEFKSYYEHEHGRLEAGHNLESRLQRVEAKGTSSFMHDNAEDVMCANRTGDHEARLTVDEIIDKYCINRPQRG